VEVPDVMTGINNITAIAAIASVQATLAISIALYRLTTLSSTTKTMLEIRNKSIVKEYWANHRHQN
jgi:hypothetical protein